MGCSPKSYTKCWLTFAMGWVKVPQVSQVMYSLRACGSTLSDLFTHNDSLSAGVALTRVHCHFKGSAAKRCVRSHLITLPTRKPSRWPSTSHRGTFYVHFSPFDWKWCFKKVVCSVLEATAKGQSNCALELAKYMRKRHVHSTVLWIAVRLEWFSNELEVAGYFTKSRLSKPRNVVSTYICLFGANYFDVGIQTQKLKYLILWLMSQFHQPSAILHKYNILSGHVRQPF